MEFPINFFADHGILVQDFIMTNLIDENKTILLRKRGKVLNSPKTFSLYWSFL